MKIKQICNNLFSPSMRRKQKAIEDIGFSENWHDINQTTTPDTRPEELKVKDCLFHK